ncbi:MAG: hypothetical protein Kilf2KO_42180 [Rhodospirillales bacterium]
MIRKAVRGLGVALALALLAGCQARTEALKPIAASNVQSYRVAAVEVTAGDPSVGGSVLSRLDISLREATDVCATGDKPVVLDARVDHYREAGTAATILAGDVTVLAGRVALRDPQTRRLLASSYIESSVGGGGLIGVVVTELGEEGLTDTFASDVCEEIWQVRPPEQTFKPGGSINED